MIHPIPFVWPYALLFWTVFVWVFVPESALIRRTTATKDDAGSVMFILIGNQLATFLGIVAAFVVPAATFSRGRLAAFWAGTALLAAGSLLRRHCFRVLGKFFTGAVKVQEDHRVIDAGAYRWIRHPSYAAGIMVFGSIGLAMGNWVSVALLLAIPFAVYSYRIAVEERALLLRIGEPYAEYMRRTKRLIPFVI